MNLKQGARKTRGYEGSFGQSRAVNWSNFAGVLAQDGFVDASDYISKRYKQMTGAAKTAPSLARTMMGKQHKKGMTAEKKEQITKAMADNEATILSLGGEISTANTTIADQQDQISTLQSQVEALTPTETEQPSMQVEPDEGVI